MTNGCYQTDPAHANETMVTEIVSQFRNAQVKQFIEEKLIYEAYGLVDPATKVVFIPLRMGMPFRGSRALLFGSTNESQYVYAKRDGQDNVFAVDMADFNNTTVEDFG